MKRLIPLLIGLCLLALLAACQPELEEVTVEVTRVVTETVEVEGEAVEVTRVVTEEDEVASSAPTGEAVAALAPVSANLPQQRQAQRLIIKNADMAVTVNDTEAAANEATAATVGAGGYIISQRVWDANGYRYATMTLGVPVTEFERVLRALRTLGTVTNDAASGDDVTEEFVDLESRLATLRTTHTRLLGFLEEAENVEEILALNEQIAEVETELSRIQGRMQYLQNRAAFSTINLQLNPFVPTPTPTPTATPTPLPTPQNWHPADTARVAAVQFQDTAQRVTDVAIYQGIVCGPWLLLLALMVYGAWRILRRLGKLQGLAEPRTEQMAEER
ncbi:MAG TPA: DUF4349 domain-containing protein [Candidatus Binatia bacterium]|nr:DUF4349 domain-containing protein [Candidatus Binatia bacterium]